MTAAVRSSGPNIFSMFSGDGGELYRTKRESFVFAMLGQVAIVGILVYLTTSVIPGGPRTLGSVPFAMKDLPLVFSRPGGGGGGTFDNLPASHGIPRASPQDQLAPPTVIILNRDPKLVVPQTVVGQSDASAPEDIQVGDPMAAISKALSNGRGGPGGVGDGCCDGIGPSKGPGAGPGPYRAGIGGVSLPEVIYNPEPVFSEEARKTKAQGIVVLLVVVDTDGRTRDIRVQTSLGMGLDEKAMEAVSTWRFRPAMLNKRPVPAQIAVEVNFRLY